MVVASPSLLLLLLLSCALLFGLALRRRWYRSPPQTRRPPLAKEALPLLGHALAYRANPSSFLLRQTRSLGEVFRLNLAGKRLVLVTGYPPAMRAVANASESVLSARAAVEEVGFGETLGTLSVMVGTDLHKAILKQNLSGAKLEATTTSIYSALLEAFDIELGRVADTGHRIADDLLGLVRRCYLRAQITLLLGLQVMRLAGDSFIEDFVAFQDAVEDATAKAAVAPRWLAQHFILQPVGRMRKVLARKLGAAIHGALSAEATSTQGTEGVGPWPKAFAARQTRPEDAGELAIGLLFASHKNAAIATTQAYIFCHEHPDLLASVTEDAKRFCRAPLSDKQSILKTCEAMHMCTQETLRITAHSIGAIRKVLSREGFLIPAREGDAFWVGPGETIAISHIAPNLDPATWGADAAVFRVDRQEFKAIATPPDEYKFTTFSHGLHVCPGRRFADVSIQCALAILLWGHYKTSIHGSVPSISFERATLAQRAGRVCISAERR